MSEENGNGNLVGHLKPTSSSNEDLSEYTDADESISTPTEFLAEFLSAIMLKDYANALKYCKLILQYEPNNSTAKEFYPLILEKLQVGEVEENSSYDNDSEDEDQSEEGPNSGTDSENSTTSEDSSEGQEEEEEGLEVEQSNGDKQSKSSSDGDATTGSYSSLEDEEADPINQLITLAARYQIDNVNLGNGNKIYNNTIPSSMQLQPNNFSADLTNANEKSNTLANQLPFGTSSDSESPTEPVSQQTVAMLRARVVPNKF